MKILGISAFYHDSAACLIDNGEIIAAAQEERFTRVKHDDQFPQHAVAYCLTAANIEIAEVDHVAFYEQPLRKFDRLLKTYIAYAPHGLRSYLNAIPLWMTHKLWLESYIQNKLGYKKSLIFPKHHESHAASAFYPSPFKEAAILTMDGVGEWTTTSFGYGEGNHIRLEREIRFPHSLGLLYSAFTYYTGFKVNSGEYKLMGLAPYGEPKYVEKIYENLVDVKTDGSIRLNMDYFNYATGFTMTNERFHTLFGRAPREAETAPSQLDMDLAASIQVVTEEIVLKMAQHVYLQTKSKNLCLAGGVALNCVANSKLLKLGPFERIWVQPAAGDAGGALGAALYVWHQCMNKLRKINPTTDLQQGSYLGPQYSDQQIQEFLKKKQIPHKKMNIKLLLKTTAKLIATENVVGWFQGRMEYGPRALGNRSILGDARSSKMQSIMNLKIKFRESFRPFAPAVLIDDVNKWFEAPTKRKSQFTSPYMLFTAQVAVNKRKPINNKQNQLKGIDKLKVIRSLIPAVTHVDYSARLQTVHKGTNPLFYGLLSEFKKLTSCPVMINTSFNVRGEPIAATPEDAYRCFMRTNIDYLVLGSYILDKKKQPIFSEAKKDWHNEFKLD